MKILEKLNKAIEIIKKSDLKKKGKNTFSKYDYFTPEQVSELVINACHEVKLYPKFDLVRNELGITGILAIYDIETDEPPIEFVMASAIPEIKATNISQQLGGAMTYTKRYLLMNAFDIVDNRLEFDTDENTKILVDEIYDKINSSETRRELTDIFNKNKNLHNDQRFLNALTEKKKQLK